MWKGVKNNPKICLHMSFMDVAWRWSGATWVVDLWVPLKQFGPNKMSTVYNKMSTLTGLSHWVFSFRRRHEDKSKNRGLFLLLLGWCLIYADMVIEPISYYNWYSVIAFECRGHETCISKYKSENLFQIYDLRKFFEFYITGIDIPF